MIKKKRWRLMTHKLYYKDSYLTNFEAKVVSCEPYKEGYTTLLDQTAFYPEGGGQPADKGYLNDIEVEHVFIKQDEIYHVTKEKLEIGAVVRGQVSFKRRFDYMQQHSGEHIISGLIREYYGYNNVGFHLSKEYMTADFDGEFSKADMIMIEGKANEIVFKNVPISAKIYPQGGVSDIAYRSKIELDGEVRLVTVEACDICACCGTHLTTTGQVGLIKILSSERHRGGIRLTIVCGERALKDYHKRLEAITELSGLLSARPELVVAGVKKLQGELGEIKQKLVGRTKELFEYKANYYSGSTQEMICQVEEGLAPDELRRLCVAMTEKTEALCVVLTPEGVQFKYAIGSQSIDVRPLCKLLNEAFNGRGGGVKEMCQGSFKGDNEEIERLIRDYLKQYEGVLSFS